VYLFESPARYQAFIAGRFPAFPQRRAFFVETDGQLAVYTHWNPRVKEDLRHELTHAYIHTALPSIPLWLDEALAEYFEVGIGRRGLNLAHADHLVREYQSADWRPDLDRLERLKEVEQMTQLDYAEAWCWVHWLLQTETRRAETLRAYLRVLRVQPDGAPRLWPMVKEIDPSAAEQLVQHVRRVRAER
jgi:hypothetical protein